MEFYDVIYTRRSIRKYSDNEIPKEVLHKVIIAAGKAPSGRNRQNWKYILIDDNEIRSELVKYCLDIRFIIECPVTVVLCSQIIPDHNRGGFMGEYGSLMDGAITFDHFTLAARAEGLGTCWIGRFNNDKIKKLLNIPDNWNVVALSPLGYPKEENQFIQSRNRMSYDKLISMNLFDN
jgi:nitroreductase